MFIVQGVLRNSLSAELFLVVNLHVGFYGGIFGESEGRGVEIWKAGSYLHSSDLVSFFLAKEE